MDGGLPSWRDGTTRRAIVSFVESVTSGPGAVPEPERVAVFDNDGTLWTEKPMPTQLAYMLAQWRTAAEADPSLAAKQPYRAVVSGDLSWFGAAVDKHYAGDDSDLQILIDTMLGSVAGTSVDDLRRSVAAFFRDAEHPTLHRPYGSTVYQPMVELLRYLEAHAFTCFIVSGGSRDFMRPMTVDAYGIAQDRVIGSAVGLSYDERSDAVRYTADLGFFDDGPQKPVQIWAGIGRRPILAAGNSNGDVPMLRYAQGSPRSLSLLVHHDDGTGRGDAPYDAGAEDALARAAEDGFVVVSVKDDWATVFPDA